MEKWKWIEGYKGLYKISNWGKVKSFHGRHGKKVRFVTLQKTKTGYIRFVLYKNKTIKLGYIHRLVAQTFIPNTENKPEVNHIDNKKTNNRKNNLEWATRKENIAYAIKTGTIARGERVAGCKLNKKAIIEIRELRRQGVYLKTLAKHFNVCYQSIFNIIHKKCWMWV